MASKSKFVSDFRSVVSTILAGRDSVNNLIAYYDNMGWAQVDFDPLFVNADITSADFVAAIEAQRALSASLLTKPVSGGPAPVTILSKLTP